jgi:hypothetical protein
VESESPLSFEYSDSRDGHNRIPNPQTDAPTIYPQGAPPPDSQQFKGTGKITYARLEDKTGNDDDSHHHKHKNKYDTKERRDPTHSNDVGTKEEQKHFAEMIRQSMNRIHSCDSGTQVITAPARSSHMEPVVAHPAAPVKQVVKKEKTTSLTPRRGSSQDTAGQLGERNKDDRNPNGRRPHDATPQDKRTHGRGEGRRREHGDDDHGGDDDVPRHSKDKNKKKVKRESRKPRRNYPNGGGRGDDSDPPSDDDSDKRKRNSRRDGKDDKKDKKKHPGGDDDGGDPSSDDESEDEVNLPARRNRRRRSPRARNQEIPTRPAPAICGGKQSTI